MPKRYVVENRPDGRSDITSEEDITTLPSYGDFFSGRDLWINDRTPANLDGNEDVFRNSTMTHEPPDGGAVLRVIDIFPKRSYSKEESMESHRALQSVHVPTDEEYAQLKDPSMHRTDTLNYICLISGQLWALSEGRDVLMKPGDIIVQKGCMHGWRNDGDTVARIVAILIDADTPRTTPQAG